MFSRFGQTRVGQSPPNRNHPARAIKVSRCATAMSASRGRVTRVVDFQQLSKSDNRKASVPDNEATARIRINRRANEDADALISEATSKVNGTIEHVSNLLHRTEDADS